MANSLSRFIAPLRKRAGKFRKHMRTIVARHRSHLEPAEIEALLKELIGKPPEILMVHSSLSACGYIPGGAEMVLHALEGRAQTLVMPTHTYCYPPAKGGDPPVFDPQSTRSRVGLITDVFWRQPDTLRSIHPTHSLAARGPQADEIVRGHQLCETPCGQGTPYERLVNRDAAALMFGATMHAYTFFHTAEDAAQSPYAYEPAPCELRYLNSEGTVTTMRSLKQSFDDRTFHLMDRPLEEAGLLRRQRLGRGDLLYIPCTAAVHGFLLQRLADDPYYLAARKPRK